MGYKASGIERMLQEAGLLVVDRVGGSSDFDFGHWIEMADPPAWNVEMMKLRWWGIGRGWMYG